MCTGQRRSSCRRAAATALVVLAAGAVVLGQAPTAPLSPAALELDVVRSGGAVGDVVIVQRQGTRTLRRDVVPRRVSTHSVPLAGAATHVGCEGPRTWCTEVDLRSVVPGQRIVLKAYPGSVVSGRAAPASPTPLTVLGTLRPTGGRPDGPLLRFTAAVVPDDRGHFAFLAPQGRLDLRLSRTGDAPVYRVDVEARQTASLGTTTFLKGASVAGWTRDAVSGATAPNVAVTLKRNSPVATVESLEGRSHDLLLTFRTRTDARGWFQIEGVHPGRYWLVAESGTHAPAEIEVTAEDGEETLLDDVWLQPYRTLQIDVMPPTDPAGAPWRVGVRSQGAKVRQDLQGWAHTATDPEGTARFFRALPTAHEVQINTADGSELYTDVHLFPPDPEPLVIRLPLVELTGIVTQGRVPVPGATIELSAGANDRMRFVSAEDGRFAGWMRRPEDAVFADVTPPGGAACHLSVKPEPVGDDRVQVVLELGDAAFAVSVTDEQRRPVRDALVQVTRRKGQAGPYDSTGTTGPTGQVTVGPVSAGTYQVVANHRDAGASDVVDVEVGAGQTLPLALTLQSYRNVPFKLVSSEGTPVSGASVRVRTGRHAGGWRTDQRGLATLRVPAAATNAIVTVSAPSHMLWSACIEVPSGGSLDVRLPRGGAGTLRFERPQTRPEGYTHFITNEQGGLLNSNDLLAWRLSQGLLRSDSPAVEEAAVAPEYDLQEASAVAPGYYRVGWWPIMQEDALVAAACGGMLPVTGPGGTVAAGTTLTLRLEPPK